MGVDASGGDLESQRGGLYMCRVHRDKPGRRAQQDIRNGLRTLREGVPQEPPALPNADIVRKNLDTSHTPPQLSVTLQVCISRLNPVPAKWRHAMDTGSSQDP